MATAYQPLGVFQNITGTLVAFAVGLVLTIVFRKVMAFRKMFKYYQTLPGDRDFSLLYGNMRHFSLNMDRNIAQTQAFMKEVDCRLRRIWLGPFVPIVALFHPISVKELMKVGAPKVRGFGGSYEHCTPWLGEGILISNGPRWARDRRLTNKAFHIEILKNCIPVFHTATDALMENLDRFAENGESFDIFEVISLCFFDIITRSALSLDVDAQRQRHPVVTATKDLTNIWAMRNKTVSMWPTWVFNLSQAGRTFHKACGYVHGVAYDIIRKREEAMRKGTARLSTKLLDFLDLMLQARDADGGRMTVDEVRENVDNVMFAGHDTGSSTASWFLYELACHPEYQRQIQEEVDSLLSDRDSDQIVFDDLGHLPQLTMCLRESMRLNPAIPIISRRVEADLVVGGMTVPAGTMITVPFFHLHRNPDVWEDPLKYKPERFAPENAAKIPNYAFLPFSAGSRNCPGQHFAMIELKVILSRLLRRFTVELDPAGPPVKKAYGVVLRAKRGIWIKVKKRA